MCAALLRVSSTPPSSPPQPRQLETAAAGSGGSGRSRTSSNPPRTREPLRPSPKCSLRMGADDLEPEVGRSPHQKKAKTSKDTMLVGSPLPWLRSGRTFTHPLVVEAAIIQVEALSSFQLVPLDPAHKTHSVVSSQRTVTEPPSPASPSPTHATTEAFASPSPCSSQATTVGPWTPQHGRVPIDDPYFRGRAIPSWFSEVYESDGYDTDALRIISRIPRVSVPSTPSSRTSSPGFEMTGDTTLHSARDEWVPDVWPADVKLLSGQHNPRNWKFTRVPTGARGGVGCSCAVRCTALTCLNARQSRFCNESNCAFAGGCGNALRESTALQICRNTRTGMRGLVAKRAIPAGEVIGQYFGHVQLFGPPYRTAPANDGYRMHLKTRSSGNKYMGIDALHEGGHLRLMNHHCNGAARFHEVQTGGTLMVVGVTVRDVYPGEEMTVSYGDRLWFLCRCGWWGCQHRHLQHLPSISAA